MRFNSRQDLEDVMNGPVPVGTPFFLIWRRWRRQSMAFAGAFRYKVLLGLRGLPVHTWDSDAAERILGSSCAWLEEAPQTVAREDLHEYFIRRGVVHPSEVHPAA